MEQLLTNLSHAVEGAPAIALGASAVWGVLSIILSPCHLASLPLIVGFISEQGQVTVRRAFWTATLFAVGILLTIAAIGAITAAAVFAMKRGGKSEAGCAGGGACCPWMSGMNLWPTNPWTGLGTVGTNAAATASGAATNGQR